MDCLCVLPKCLIHHICFCINIKCLRGHSFIVLCFLFHGLFPLLGLEKDVIVHLRNGLDPGIGKGLAQEIEREIVQLQETERIGPDLGISGGHDPETDIITAPTLGRGVGVDHMTGERGGAALMTGAVDGGQDRMRREAVQGHRRKGHAPRTEDEDEHSLTQTNFPYVCILFSFY